MGNQTSAAASVGLSASGQAGETFAVVRCMRLKKYRLCAAGAFPAFVGPQQIIHMTGQDSFLSVMRPYGFPSIAAQGLPRLPVIQGMMKKTNLLFRAVRPRQHGFAGNEDPCSRCG